MLPLLNPLPADEIALLEQAAAFGDFPSLAELTTENLSSMTRERGIDFATALLYDRLRKSPAHAPFITRLEAAFAAPSRIRPAVNWRIVIVPGALYIERPDLGGAGQLVRETATKLGLRCDLVPLASRGSVRENAARLAAWLEQQPDEPLVLVSLSKGGPDLKLALARPDAPHLFRNVTAWVNVCGPLDGSPVADWISASRLRLWAMRLQYRIQRRDFGFITDMCHGPGSLLREPLKLPEHMSLVSLVGFPLRRHLSTSFSRFCHGIIARLGPNDGTVLLSDGCSWPGDVFPVWGSDHYFLPASLGRSLVTTVLHCLAERPEPS